jgi:hypothetical protein
MLVPHQRDIIVLGNVGVINVWAHVVPLKKAQCVPKLAICKKMHKFVCTPNVAPAILTLVHLRSWRPEWMCNPCLKVVVVSHLFAIPVLLCKSLRQQDKGGMTDQWRRRLLERNLQKGKLGKQKRVPVLHVREGHAHWPCTFIVFCFGSQWPMQCDYARGNATKQITIVPR